MGKISIRMTNAEESQIKNAAQTNGLTLTDFVKAQLFDQDIGAAQFDDFKKVQIEANGQIAQLLLDLTIHTRTGNNLIAELIRLIAPDSAVEILRDAKKRTKRTIKKSVEEDDFYD